MQAYQQDLSKSTLPDESVTEDEEPCGGRLVSRHFKAVDSWESLRREMAQLGS